MENSNDGDGTDESETDAWIAQRIEQSRVADAI